MASPSPQNSPMPSPQAPSPMGPPTQNPAPPQSPHSPYIQHVNGPPPTYPPGGAQPPMPIHMSPSGPSYPKPPNNNGPSGPPPGGHQMPPHMVGPHMSGPPGHPIGSGCAHPPGPNGHPSMPGAPQHPNMPGQGPPHGYMQHQIGHMPSGQAPLPLGSGPPPGNGPVGSAGPPHGVLPGQAMPGHMPPTSSPMAGSLSAPDPDNIIALQRAIYSMEEKSLQEDPRYSQLLALRARLSAGPAHDSARGMFFNVQLSQLRAQITAYRSLARNQPLSQQILMIATGKRADGASPECPTPRAQPPVGEGQGPPEGAGAAGEPARGGGGGAPPTPLPMIGQMAPPEQLTPPLVHPPMGGGLMSGPEPLRPAGAQPAENQAGIQGPGAKQNLITSIPKPVGIDPIQILNERENRIAARIAHRIETLSSLPANIPDDLRLQALIELRALRVLNCQKQLRAEITLTSTPSVN